MSVKIIFNLKIKLNQKIINKLNLGLTKLLVVAGYDITDLNHAEVIDLVNEDADCGLPAAYPHNVFGVAGALLDGDF
jgi:hypothetical protein